MRYSALVLTLLLAGCVSSGTRVSESQTLAFHPGVTTRAEIVSQLGEPNSTFLGADGSRRDSYVYIEGHVSAMNFVPVVGLLAGGARGSSQVAIFTYEPSGVLRSTDSGSSQTDVRTGLLNQ